ncbi:TlpA disulfide reductase family protein [Edaphobacter paludis]|uniref:TlpA disulfide reductase family protein n=1 Tax=Edaphobacter paludis TaxID=3035702 RepID=A0AAU7D506_9BACT
MKKLIAIALCMACICVTRIADAKSVPSLVLKDTAGHSQKLSGLHGQIVVLSFWATWCAPCREELPRLSKLSEEFAGRNVHFVAVSIDDAKDRGKIEPYLMKQDIHLDVWVGGSAELLGRFGMGDIVPGTLILDEQGQVITRIMGEAKDEDIRSRLDWLLNGRQDPAPEQMLKRY